MLEVNGVCIYIAKPKTPEEIATIQTKADCCYFVQRTIDKLGSFLLHKSNYILGSLGAYHHAYIFYDLCNFCIGERNTVPLKDVKSYTGQTSQLFLDGNNRMVVEDMLLHCDQMIAYYSLCLMSKFVMPNLLSKLQGYFVRKYEHYATIIIDNNKLPQIPDYKDIKYSEKTVEVEKTQLGAISCFSMEEIEQKVFYRREVYEYHYLMKAYSENPNGRDHTGQPYDASQFYRVDDNNIKYID